MPNWCYTDMVIKGPLKELKYFDKAYTAVRKNAKIETSFGEGWLGHILSYLGSSEDEILRGNIRCRGAVNYYLFDPDGIELSTETAWGPMFEPIILLRDKYAPHAKISYTSVETGMGYFETSDPKLAGKYYIETACCDDLPPILEFDGPARRGELGESLERALGKEGKLQDLLDEAEEKYGFYARKFEKGRIL